MKRTTSQNARELDALGYSDDSVVPMAGSYLVTRTGRDGTVCYLDRGGWYHPARDETCFFKTEDDARRVIITAAAGCAA